MHEVPLQSASAAGSRRRWNLNKLFGRLGIRSKLTIAFVALAGLPLAFVGWYAADQHLQSLTDAVALQQRRSLAAMRESVHSLLTSVQGDLELIAGSESIASLLDRRSSAAADGMVMDGSGTADAAVESELQNLLLSKPHYRRVRLLGQEGAELVHVAAVDGVPRVFPAGRWWDTGFSYYHALVQDLDREEVAFAPVELLGVEQASGSSVAARAAEAEAGPDSLVPALSVVRLLDDSDGAPGALIVADVYARALFELLRTAELRSGESVLLVGPNGSYLFNSAKTTDWKTPLVPQSEDNLRQNLPAALVEKVLSGEQGVALQGLDAVVSYAPLFEPPYRSLGNYALVSIVPKDEILSPVRSVRRFVRVTGTLTLLMAGLLALVAARQFAAPIQALTRGAKRLAEGEFDASLDIETNDEIEDLAHSFTSMARALAAREREVARQGKQLKRYTEHLEAMVEERTRALKVSQRRLIQHEKMVAVGQVAAGVAHELGTPLATILCHSQMALEALAERSPVRAMLPDGEELDVEANVRMVIEQASRCRDIVRSFFGFSRPPSNEPSRVSVDALVRKVVRLLAHELERRGTLVRVRNESPAAGVIGIENELEQVLVNIVRNAADAMPDGGELEVCVDVEEEPTTDPGIGYGDGPRRGTVMIAFEDSGCGMGTEIQTHIFEPFFTTKAPNVGTGLGLWIAYKTVSEHGGAIEVESAPGKGTRVVVLLPRAP